LTVAAEAIGVEVRIGSEVTELIWKLPFDAL
jgi:hypothetical protein